MFASKDLFFTNSGGYKISRSVRLRNSATAYLTRVAGTPTSQNVWTVSMWVKMGNMVTGATAAGGFFGANQAGNPNESIKWDGATTTIYYQAATSGGTHNLTRNTSRVFRDPGSWYHLVFQKNAAANSGTGCFLMWVNGVSAALTGAYVGTQASVPDYINISGNTFNIGAIGAGNSLDAYLAEINFVDGQALTPTSFGETDAVTGVWKPKKYTGTYGNNGFYLNFSDNSAATAAAIGKDYSGNGNNFTPTNISVTAGTTYDSMLDSPTPYADGGNGRGNYPVWNTLKKVANNYTITNGNLQASDASASNTIVWATMYLPTSGKWYWEITNVTGSGLTNVIGAAPDTYADSTGTSATGFYRSNGQIQNAAGTNVTSGNTYTNGDVIGVAVDVGAGTVQFYKNNVAQGATPSFTFTAGAVLVPFCAGDNSAGTKTYAANFGQQPFTYTPPTGFVALNTQNLPTPAISNGANYMAATAYTATPGTGATISNAVNGVSFQPDLLWVKNRDNVETHYWQDSVRGFSPSANVTKMLISASNAAESSLADITCTITSSGFTVVDSNPGTGEFWLTNRTYVAWQWKAGTTSASNTNGSITSTVSAGATQGFSVVTYTGTGANATVGHGLGVAPKMIFVKKRSAIQAWSAYHASLANTQYLVLNTTAAVATLATMWNSTTPTSSVFSIGTDGNTNASAATYVAYCFSEVAGYSKIGSYTGNGSADGPFVYTEFRPRFVMYKRTDTTGNWIIYDSSRSPYNQPAAALYPNLTNAEDTSHPSDFLSNGFKLKSTGADSNASGGTFIYAAFAENPFKLSLAR